MLTKFILLKNESAIGFMGKIEKWFDAVLSAHPDLFPSMCYNLRN